MSDDVRKYVTLEKKLCFCRKFDVDAYGFTDRKGTKHTWIDCYFVDVYYLSL